MGVKKLPKVPRLVLSSFFEKLIEISCAFDLSNLNGKSALAAYSLTVIPAAKKSDF